MTDEQKAEVLQSLRQNHFMVKGNKIQKRISIGDLACSSGLFVFEYQGEGFIEVMQAYDNYYIEHVKASVRELSEFY